MKRAALVLASLLAACAAPSGAAPVVSMTAAVDAPAPPSAIPTPPPPSATPTAAMSAAPAAGGLPPTHARPECNAGERRFFACDAKEGAASRKIVVCGESLGKPDASLALVFGEAARTESEVRVPVSADGKLVRYARYTRPRVTYLRAAFMQGATTYEISDDSDEEQGRPERDAALTIKANGKPDRVLQCTGKPKESLMGLEDYLKLQEPWF